jgi:hypothetical protein
MNDNGAHLIARLEAARWTLAKGRGWKPREPAGQRPALRDGQTQTDKPRIKE